MSDAIITVDGLGKRYRLGSASRSGERYTVLRDVLSDKAKSLFRANGRRSNLGDIGLPHPANSHPQAAPASEDFWALKDVSFEVSQGEVLGIIGRNGAGKSTLLKILSRITEPTEGRIRLRGRVASLLEVGTGFHPELTGRENISLNGAILGMARTEIKAKFDEIVAFAEVEKFLDTPVKRYSSGMYVRLAFAVAAHLEPEILIVDEVLAVGDADFQKKCLGKMRQLSRGQSRTVLFVSHNMPAVLALCTSAITLAGGHVKFRGPATAAVMQYGASGKTTFVDLSRHPNRGTGRRRVFRRLRLCDGRGRETNKFAALDALTVEFFINCPERLKFPKFGIGVNKEVSGERIFAIATYLSQSPIEVVQGDAEIRCTFGVPALVPGTYTLDISLADVNSNFIDEIPAAASFEVIDSGYLEVPYTPFSEMGSLLVTSSWTAEGGSNRI